MCFILRDFTERLTRWMKGQLVTLNLVLCKMEIVVQKLVVIVEVLGAFSFDGHFRGEILLPCLMWSYSIKTVVLSGGELLGAEMEDF